MWIVDPHNARITVLDGNGRPEDDFGYSGQIFYTAPVDSNRVVVSGPMVADERFSPFAIHVMNSRGRIMRSFARWPSTRENRRVAVTPEGTVLASYERRYVLEEWSVQGELLRTLSRDLDWFPPGTQPGYGEAALANGVVDGDGRLWVALIRPESEMVRNQRNRPMPGLDVMIEDADAVVEVIDLATLQVVARGERDTPYLFPIVPFDGRYMSPAQDSLGYVSFQILEAVVNRRRE